MEPKSEISYVSPNEMNEAKYRTMSVSFSCLVKMFDSGTRFTQGGFLQIPKPLPPQWFKSEMRLTMELVADADPYTLGVAIKEAYKKLKQHIEQYESFGEIN